MSAGRSEKNHSCSPSELHRPFSCIARKSLFIVENPDSLLQLIGAKESRRVIRRPAHETIAKIKSWV
jgi:hypothetical protein